MPERTTVSAIPETPFRRALAALRREAAETLLLRSIFLRMMGLIYLAAFGSLAIQIRGLIGERGILPVGDFLSRARDQYGPIVYERLPTLLWLGHSDAMLLGLCWAGIAVSILIVLDIAPAASLAAAWVLFLSISLGGQRFLEFQWDVFLIEAGFWAIFFAPWRMRPAWGKRLAGDPAPPWAALWMLRWLLFRLYFASGAVKLISGDPNWRDLTALAYHYESQPLPTWGGWFFHQAPLWFQKFSCLSMFFIELATPFFIFAPRRVRRLGCGCMIVLQGLIALTGNYAIFNWITVAICLLLLDDGWLRKRLPQRWRGDSDPPPARPTGRAQNWTTAIVAIAVLPCTLAVISQLALGRVPRIPFYGPLQNVLYFDVRIVGNYGLFAVMTTGRREIAIEGSNDGVEWREYRWRWKPDDPMQRPRFLAPHQPRLDWQMWFAALGDPVSLQVVERLMQKLLQGEPSVAALMGPSPFPDAPPKYIRATVYRYHMTDGAALLRTGAWWSRERVKELIPPATLADSRRAERP